MEENNIAGWEVQLPEEEKQEVIPYVSLHNHTMFSIMDSLTKPEDLIKKCKELGMPAVAITDHGNLFGIWDAFIAAGKLGGIKLIAGCEFYFVDDVADKEARIRHVICLAKNQIGYKNLLTLSKFGYDNAIISAKKVVPRIDWNLLEKYHEGMLCTTACGGGVISQLLNQKRFEEAEKQAQRLKNIFGEDLAIELQPHALKRAANFYGEQVDQMYTNRQLKKIAEKLDIKMIAATDSHYIDKSDYNAHDTFLSMGSGQPKKSNNRLRYNVNDFYVKSGAEVKAFFARTYGEDFANELIANTLYFADKCEKPKWIDPKFTNPSGKELPDFPVHDQGDFKEFLNWKQHNYIDGLGDDAMYLRYKCEIGLNKMIPTEKHDQYKERLKEEFDVLEFHGFSSYMLITMDFLEFARKENIPVGVGRGCLSFNTKVLTEHGFKNLGEINIGERVFTDKFYIQKVINKFEFNIKNDEKCLEINTQNSFKNLIMTKDHEVLAFKAVETEEYKNVLPKYKGKVKRWKKIRGNPEWIKAKDLSKNDFIYTKFPSKQSRVVPRPTDLSKFIDYKYIKPEITDKFIIFDFKNQSANYQIKINRYIEHTEDFYYFIGRFVGDGWFRSDKTKYKNDSFHICFNINDKSGIEKISNILTNFGLKLYHKDSIKTNVHVITVHNKIFVDYLRSIFPEYNEKPKAYNKCLPNFFRYCNNLLLKSMLIGLLDADGSIDKDTGRENIDTISLKLALQIKESLLYLDIPSRVSVSKEKIGFIKGKEYKFRESYKIRFSGLTSRRKNQFIIKNDYYNGYFSKILDIKETSCDKVYDITVENDHCYLTSNGIVHNSVGGCLVAYLIGIHQADPIKYNLIFARFHNRDKTSFPDIDNDVPPEGKEPVQAYLRKKYGEDYVAHVSNMNTLTPKVYARAIARSYEYGGDRKIAVQIGTAMADAIPTEIKSVKQALQKAPLFIEYAKKYTELNDFASALDGKPVALSTHAGGQVISKRSLTGLVPLRRDKEGSLVLEYEKERAEANGLIKIDILGLETLKIIEDTLKLIKQNGKEIPNITNYDANDEKTYKLISSGKTFCVFQLGTSGGTIELCKKIKPKCLEDVAIINALARPAVKEIRVDFVKTKNGEKEVKLLHPSLERAFKHTYGFGLFEESLMYLAQDVAGWSLHAADRLRKLTKDKGKSNEKAIKWREEFIDGAEKNGVGKELGTEIWDTVISAYSGYGFNFSHAIFYSMLGYQTAYLKAHFPLEFMVANLMSEVTSNAKISKDNIAKIKEEIRSLKINILPPDINTSQMTYTIIDDNTLLTGLDSLKYIGKDAIPEILKKRPFTSFEDFLTKIDGKLVRAPAIQACAASGCLDYFGLPRKLMYLYASDYKKKLQLHLKKKNKTEFKYPWPQEKEWAPHHLYALEVEFLGEGLTGDKFSAYNGFFTKGAYNFNNFPKMLPPPEEDLTEKERRAYSKRLGSIQAEIKSIFEFKVKKAESSLVGQVMAKIKLEDPYGNQIDMTCFPKTWIYFQDRVSEISHNKVKLEPGVGIWFSGNMNWYDDSISIIFEELERICLPPQLPDDLESKKVVMKSTRVSKKDKVDESNDIDNTDRSFLLEEIENELVELGMSDLDDEEN